MATGFLLVLQFAYPYIPFLREHFKNSRFITYYLTGSDNDSLLVESLDSSLFDQIDTLQVPDSSENFTLPPLNKIDEAWFVSDSFIVPDTANLAQLATFLTSLKGKKVRIAYWGDSMIEGDLITQTLRRRLQKKYGGRGVGFVPFVSISAGFRRTVIHTYGGPWKYYSLVKNAKTKKAPFGLSGEYMMQGSDTTGQKIWARYQAPKDQKSWTRVKVFYGKGNGKALAWVKLNKGKEVKVKLNDTAALNTLVFADSAIRDFHIRFDSAYSTVLFGVSLESEDGAQVDNLNLRGNSGMAMTRVGNAVFRGFDKELEPDLIVLQFGSNVINASTLDYRWYEKAMLQVIRHYQASFPEVPILIVGVADKSFKKEDEMVSDPSVQRVLKLQYKLALKTGVSFWSLYSAMGGDGSMVAWADGEQPLANKDYTHLNHRGAEKVGNLLYDFLLQP